MLKNKTNLSIHFTNAFKPSRFANLLTASLGFCLLTNGGVHSQAATIHFLFNDDAGTFGYGTLEAPVTSINPWSITSGNLILTTGSFQGEYFILPNPLVTIASTSPMGSFIFDNLFYPAGNEYLNSSGLLFTGGGLEINIWGNPSAPYSYYVSDAPQSYLISNNNSQFIVTAITTSSVPEPGAIAFIASSGIATGVLLRRRRKK